MSVIEQVLDYWRPKHEAGTCGDGVRELRGPTGGKAVCPFCVADLAGVSVAEVMEG